MGSRVSAAEAAQLVHKHERVVRRRVARGDLRATKDEQGRWQIDTDDLAAIWRVDPEQLATLHLGEQRTRSGILQQLQAAQATVQRLERRMTALEQALDHAIAGLAPGREKTARSEGAGDALAQGGGVIYQPNQPTGASDPLAASGDVLGSHHGLSPDARHILSDYPPARLVSLADHGDGSAVTFRTKTDAARWLLRHGVNSETTPRGWRGWPPEDLTPAGVLIFALGVWRDAQARRDWRVAWSLHRCDNSACSCHTLLIAE